MSGASATPRGAGSRGFGRAALEVVLALTVMYSAVILGQGDRIENDCLCSHAGGLAIQWTAGLLLAAFLLWLLWLAIGAWRRWRPVSLRGFLFEQRHHAIAAIVPWITAILGIVLLTVPSQTADMLAGIQGKDVRWPLVPFGLGAFVWGMSTWFCGRWAIDIERRTSRRAENWLALWNPRLIALLTGFAIIIITVKAAGLCSFAVLVASAVAGLVFLIAVFRRPISRVLYPSWRSGGAARLAAARAPGKGRLGEFFDDIRAAPGGPVVVFLALAAGLLVIGVFAVNPGVAAILEAPGTVLLGIGCLTIIATFLSKAGSRLARFPVLFSLLAITTLLGRWDIGVNHDIRTLPPRTGTAASPARSLDDAAAEWLSVCGPGLVDSERKGLKVVLVSTAGGASRAALWTFHALSDLQDQDRQFPRRVFAISAVSGGALGATVWSALLARENFDCSRDIADARAAAQRRADGQEILSHDFLAPVLAAWLSRDIPLGVVPLNSVLRHIGLQAEDRATALEQAFEAAWPAKYSGDNFLASDFMSLWGPAFNRPLLLLNGTVEDTGLPIVTAPVSLMNQQGKPNGDLPATYDARWLLGEPIRTSTAVLNAARFPVVTPQGDIRVPRCPDGSILPAGACDAKDASAGDMISVVDGGYFDNIGGGTTMRAAAALRRAFDRSGFPERGITLRIMVVGINSDPDRLISDDAWKWLDPAAIEKGTKHEAVDQLMRCGQGPSTLIIGEKGLDNALDAEIAPVLAIIATQSGHTAMRMAELNQQFCSRRHRLAAPDQTAPDPAAPTNYIMLSLCPVGDRDRTISLPLNWVLPPATLRLFAGDDPDHWDLTNWCGNTPQLHDYRDWAAQP